MKYLIFVIMIFTGCETQTTPFHKVVHVNPSPDLSFFQSKTIYCNEFGMAYYRNVQDRHTSFIPVYKSTTEVATCEDMARLRNKELK